MSCSSVLDRMRKAFTHKRIPLRNHDCFTILSTKEHNAVVGVNYKICRSYAYWLHCIARRMWISTVHRHSVPVQPKGAHWGWGQGSVVLPTLEKPCAHVCFVHRGVVRLKQVQDSQFQWNCNVKSHCIKYKVCFQLCGMFGKANMGVWMSGVQIILATSCSLRDVPKILTLW